MRTVFFSKRPALFFFGSLIAFSASLHGQIMDQTPAGQTDAVVHLRVHADHPAPATLPDTLFGSFLEPIGHSTYGGLWAEILDNGSLEEDLWSAGEVGRMVTERPELDRASRLGVPFPWEPLDGGQGNRYEPRWGDAANSNRSLEIMALPGVESGIRERVYLPVHRTLHYTGSIWIKHLAGPAEVSVSLRKRNDAKSVFAEAKIDATSGDWTRYAFQLELQPGQVGHLEPADFVVALSNNGRALVDQVSLMPSDNVDGMDPDVVAMARDLKPSVVRFGGNFTSGYHWREGIGPRDKRVSEINLAWGIPEYNTFGTDEFLRFCELVHARPQIALNLGTGTPEEAADWVKYVDDKWGDKRGGQLWELGNELWGNWNTGYPTREEIGDRTRAFSEAVRKADPTSKLIATGQDVDAYREWNAVQLANPPHTFDYLSTHFVVGTDRVRMPNASNSFIAEAAFALPIGLGRKLEEMTEQIKSSGHPEVKIAFTEWLFVSNRQSMVHAAPDFNNMGGAIATGGFLNMLISHADIVPISDMTGIIEFAGIWKKREQVYGAPGYWVLRSFAEAAPAHLLPVDSDAPKYSVKQGVDRLPEIPDVPWLDVTAATNADGDVVLFCVNRNLERDYRAEIHLDGFNASSTVTTKTISAPSIYDRNSEDDPDAVGVEASTLAASKAAGGSSMKYVFPHSSVVVLQFHRASAR